MRIALNLMFVAPGVAGGRVYCDGLLRGLAAVDAENEYVVYTRRDTRLPELPAERFRQVRMPVEGPSACWRTVWEYGVLPGLVRRGGFDVFHGLGSLSPTSKSCPFVLTVHDLIYRHFPASVPLDHRLFMCWVQPFVARRADRILVPSRYTAEEVEQGLGVPRERIIVTPLGPGNGFRPVTDAEQVEAALRKHGLRRPFLISVARGYAHKNLAGLLRALACLRDFGHAEPQLALVGDRYRVGRELDRLTAELGLRDRVVCTGFVCQDELNALYTAATVFAFPSLVEGFGLPVLEAMACGAPVVASNRTAVPEVVGEAGVLADAANPEAFAMALASVLDDGKRGEELREKGLVRVKAFSWEKCAAETLAAYQKVR